MHRKLSVSQSYLGNTAQWELRASADLLPQSCSMKNGKYIQYSRIFHTFARVKTLAESPCPIMRCCLYSSPEGIPSLSTVNCQLSIALIPSSSAWFTPRRGPRTENAAGFRCPQRYGIRCASICACCRCRRARHRRYRQCRPGAAAKSR